MSNECGDIDPAVYRFADAAKEVIALVDAGLDAFAWVASSVDAAMIREVAEQLTARIELQMMRIVFLSTLGRILNERAAKQVARTTDEAATVDSVGRRANVADHESAQLAHENRGARDRGE